MIRTLIVTAAVGTALVAGSGPAGAEVPAVFHAPVRTLETPLDPWPWERTITPLPLRCEEDEPCRDPNVLQSRRWGATPTPLNIGPGGHTRSAGPLRPAP